MSDIIETLTNIFSKILRINTAPNDMPLIINETVPAAGKEFNLYKELGSNIPNNIEIWSDQNFTLEFSARDVSVNQTWPRTLALGVWQKWRGEGWYRIKITPAAPAAIDAHISGKDKGSFVRGRSN